MLLVAAAACTSDTETSDETTPGGEASGRKTSGQAATDDAPDVQNGRQAFVTTCATCHGPDARGVEGLGKKLVDDPYVRKSSDEELFRLIDEGRDPGHPQNETGVAMPPRGGNPTLTDGDIRDLVAYLRTLQG